MDNSDSHQAHLREILAPIQHLAEKPACSGVIYTDSMGHIGFLGLAAGWLAS